MLVQRQPEYRSTPCAPPTGRCSGGSRRGRRNSRYALLAAGQSVQQLRAWLTGQPEYYLRRGGGTVAGFIGAVIGDLVRDVGDAALRYSLAVQLQSAAGRLRTAGLAASAARAAFAMSLMLGPAGATATVQGLFSRYTHRPADARLTSFVAQLRAGVNLSQVVAALLASTTYAA